jgi:hypothetical protein
MTDLPVEAQLFPIFALCVDDVNGDGKSDLIAAGNLNAVQTEIGRYDAGYGIVLSGDAKGGFKAIPSQVSGFVVRGEGRDIKSLVTSEKRSCTSSPETTSQSTYFRRIKNKIMKRLTTIALCCLLVTCCLAQSSDWVIEANTIDPNNYFGVYGGQWNDRHCVVTRADEGKGCCS